MTFLDLIAKEDIIIRRLLLLLLLNRKEKSAIKYEHENMEIHIRLLQEVKIHRLMPKMAKLTN